MRAIRCCLATLMLGALAAAQTHLSSEIDKVFPTSEALYLDIHQHPELSLHEVETARKIADHLRDLGYEVTTGFGGNGVVGVLKNGDGPVVMLRTELDALPVPEKTGLPYASHVMVRDDSGEEVPVMHACGHDLHMAALIGTATIMAQDRASWHGTLIVIGQPAEERVKGAAAMLKDGLYTKFPKPQYAIAVHDGNELPAGQIGYTPGYMLTSADSVDIVIHGRGGHGSTPEVAIDPIVIAARTILDLQTIVSREITPGEHAVITVGAVHAGTKNNIIPDDAKLQLTVRAYKPEVRRHLIEAIARIAKADAAAANAPREPEVTVTESTPATYSDPDLTNRIAAAEANSLGAENVKRLDPGFASEDFSQFATDGVKISMLSIGAVDPVKFAEAKKTGEVLPGPHNSHFAPDLKPSLRTAIQTEVVALRELMGK